MLDQKGLVWITRPQEQALETAKIFEHYGFQTVIEPVLKVEYLALQESYLNQFDSIITTSTNAIEVISKTDSLKHKPLFCVGLPSKNTAVRHGFLHVIESNGAMNAQGVLQTVLTNHLNKQHKLLYLRGRDISQDITTPLKLNGFHVEEVIAYQTQIITPDKRIIDLIKERKISFITLFSAKTTEAVKAFLLTHHLDNELRKIDALCLSQSIASGISDLPWANIQVKPTIEQLAQSLQSS